jgi:hypothetical protein
VGGGPRLNWALLAAFDPDRGGRLPADLARTFQLAGESLNLVARPTERFELAGTLNHHPGHVRSDRAKQNFQGIFALAVAGRCAREPLRAHSRATAASALLSWAQVYRPSGNPIDEWFFVPLLQAVDLVARSLPPGEQTTLLNWAADFAISGDLGQQEHVEFARTSVPFDRERRDERNPVFQNAPWVPARGRVLLRLARTAFPEIRGWTEQIVDQRYDPRTKLLAAIYGEPQRRAGWA